MSTAAEIKEAIDKLSPDEWEKLEAMIWQPWDSPSGENPPGIREKLAEAAAGRFVPGNRSNIGKIHSSLE
jgi:hypothetical protein